MKLKLFSHIAAVVFLTACRTLKPVKEDYFVSRYDEKRGETYFYDQAGKEQLKGYSGVFTDTLRDYAIVYDTEGFFLIDKKGIHIYEIFPFDNGPDYTSEGTYRIIKNGKIGYVDSLTSKVIIELQFDCAWPFENGKAKVSTNCREITMDEYHGWESEEWYFINKRGQKVPE